MQEKEIQDAKGLNLIQLTCSYCREFGALKVSRGLLDDTNDTPGVNLGAFRVLKKFNEGVSPLPFEVETENKSPSAEVQKISDPSVIQSETIVVTDPSDEDKQAKTTPQEDGDSDLRDMVVKQQNMVEYLCH